MQLTDLKELRSNSGLTQSELSRLSEVSLPAIQKIEAGTANPSLSTLKAIFAPLGFKITVEHCEPDWSYLAVCGLPLSVDKRSKFKPEIELLRSELIRACHHVRLHPTERTREALEAFVLTIKLDYPSIWRKYFRSKLFSSFSVADVTGRHIKFRRIITAQLVEYL